MPCNEECFCALYIILNYFLSPWFRDEEAGALIRLCKELKFMQLICGRAGTLAQVPLMPEPLLTHMTPHCLQSHRMSAAMCYTSGNKTYNIIFRNADSVTAMNRDSWCIQSRMSFCIPSATFPYSHGP